MIECHLYFEDADGVGLKLAPEDSSRRTILLSLTDDEPVRIGHEEAAHMILHLAAFVAGFEVNEDD